MERDSLDEELEAEIAKLLDPGVERRRQVAVHELHDETGLSPALRVVAVSVAIAVILVAAGLLSLVLSIAF